MGAETLTDGAGVVVGPGSTVGGVSSSTISTYPVPALVKRVVPANRQVMAAGSFRDRLAINEPSDSIVTIVGFGLRLPSSPTPWM